MKSLSKSVSSSSKPLNWSSKKTRKNKRKN